MVYLSTISYLLTYLPYFDVIFYRPLPGRLTFMMLLYRIYLIKTSEVLFLYLMLKEFSYFCYNYNLTAVNRSSN